MTPAQQIRNNIDDQVQIGFADEISYGKDKVYQLNARNIWDLTVVLLSDDSDEPDTEIDPSLYTVYPMAGQIKGTLPEGEIGFEYKHAAFTDAEIEFYYTSNGSSVNKATLKCLELLLSSAAKRYDYKAGIKDIKASQVFDHLKSLYDTFKAKVEEEDNDISGTSGGIFVTRLHPAYKVDLSRRNPDVSRRDS